MFRQNFILTIRNILKNKSFTVVSSLSLVVGLVVFLLTFHYYLYEQSFDGFFDGSNRIYRVNTRVMKRSEVIEPSAVTSLGMFYDLKGALPGVEINTCTYFEPCLVRYQDSYLSNQRVLWVEEDFEKVFNIQLVAGTASFNRPLVGVIAQSKANVLFGDSEMAIGKIIRINEGMPVEVIGVYKDLPSNTHLDADYYFSIKTFVHFGWMPEFSDSWDGNYLWNYIKTKSGVSANEVEQQLNEFAKSRLGFLTSQEKTARFELQPLSDLHFVRGLNQEFGASATESLLIIILLIGGLTLLVALLNYTNLNAANLYRRGRETWLRKVLGATKPDLFTQVFVESMMINALAVLLAYVVYQLILPGFSRYFDIPITTSFIPKGQLPLMVFLLFIGGTLFCSLFGFAKIQHHEVKTSNKSTGGIKKRFVVIQIMVSIVLIISTIVVFRQVSQMQKASLGIKLDQVLVVSAPASTNGDSNNRRNIFLSFRDQLLSHPVFTSVSASVNIPGQEPRFRNHFYNPSSAVKPDELFLDNWVDNQFIETYGLHLLAGRNFDLDILKDTATLIINKRAAELLGFNTPDDAIGKQILNGQNRSFRIIGVVDNFHNQGLQKSIYPLTFEHQHPFEFGYYSIKISGNDQSEAIRVLTGEWKKNYPQDQLNYFFEQEYFNRQYANEKRFGRLFVLFTLLSVCIACLGLYGLILFYAGLKTKEIGIRKVNGAKVSEILFMLNKAFVKLVALAFVVAVPLAWFVTNKWLENFAYKSTLSWWIFALSGIIALGIALLTVSWHSWRAARRNPVEALRYE